MKDVEELYNTAIGFLDELGDRVDPAQARMVRLNLRAGEWPRAINGLLAVLTKRAIPLTPAEHRIVLALADDLGFGEDKTSGLIIEQPPAGDEPAPADNVDGGAPEDDHSTGDASPQALPGDETGTSGHA